MPTLLRTCHAGAAGLIGVARAACAARAAIAADDRLGHIVGDGQAAGRGDDAEPAAAAAAAIGGSRGHSSCHHLRSAGSAADGRGIGKIAGDVDAGAARPAAAAAGAPATAYSTAACISAKPAIASGGRGRCAIGPAAPAAPTVTRAGSTIATGAAGGRPRCPAGATVTGSGAGVVWSTAIPTGFEDSGAACSARRLRKGRPSRECPGLRKRNPLWAARTSDQRRPIAEIMAQANAPLCRRRACGKRSACNPSPSRRTQFRQAAGRPHRRARPRIHGLTFTQIQPTRADVSRNNCERDSEVINRQRRAGVAELPRE